MGGKKGEFFFVYTNLYLEKPAHDKPTCMIVGSIFFMCRKKYKKKNFSPAKRPSDDCSGQLCHCYHQSMTTATQKPPSFVSSLTAVGANSGGHTSLHMSRLQENW